MSHLYDYWGAPRGLGEHLENMIISFKETRIQWTSALWSPRQYGHLVVMATSLCPSETPIHIHRRYSRKIGWGCAALFPKPLHCSWPKTTIFPTSKVSWPIGDCNDGVPLHCEDLREQEIYRGYYMPARGYEFYLRVVNSIFHEWAQRTSEISSWPLFKCRVILSSQKLIFPNGMVSFWSNNWPGPRNRSW